MGNMMGIIEDGIIVRVLVKTPHGSPEATKNQKDKIPEHNVLLFNVTQRLV